MASCPGAAWGGGKAMPWMPGTPADQLSGVGWGGVVHSPTLPNGMDMSACDPAEVGANCCRCMRFGNQSTQLADSGWLQSMPEGFVFVMIRQRAAGNVVASKAAGNGVAYVLISHGANRFGGFTADGNCLGASGFLRQGPLEHQSQYSTTHAALRKSPNDFSSIPGSGGSGGPTAMTLCYAPRLFLWLWRRVLARASPDRSVAMVLSPPSSRLLAFQARQGQGSAAVIAGLVVVAASTLAIRMAARWRRGRNCNS